MRLPKNCQVIKIQYLCNTYLCTIFRSQTSATKANTGARNAKARVGSRVPGPGSRTARDGNGFRDHEETSEDEDLVDETPLKQRYDFNIPMR